MADLISRVLDFGERHSALAGYAVGVLVLIAWAAAGAVETPH